METYTFLREFADSWVLLAMTMFFIGMVLWTLRPGSKPVHDDVANIPLRNEQPAEDDKPAVKEARRERGVRR